VFSEKDGKSYCIKDIVEFKDIFEDADILKCGYKQKEDYIFLKNLNIDVKNLMFDIEIAGYILNSNINKYTIEYLANEYIQFDVDAYISSLGTVENKDTQLNLFDNSSPALLEENYQTDCIYVYVIKQLQNVLASKMKETDSLDLFSNIEMPLSEVLADMQYVRNVC